jgi:HAD superfamily, subfamily IIIB (Acid phosphatase)
MFAAVNTLHRRPGRSTPGRRSRFLAGCVLVAALILTTQPNLQAADCPPERLPNIPKSEEPALNIDKHKKQLRAYHNDVPPGASASAYVDDIKLVIGDALTYVTGSAASVKKPAVILDIDETSLSNWKNLDLNDFGFIPDGSCSLQARHACGFSAWIQRAEASRIAPTLEFFNAVRDRQIAVFFVTGRRDSQRGATIRNLKREGFRNWSGLMTRPDDDQGPIAKFKAAQRARIESDDKKWGYKIIANIGDQKSDLEGDPTGCPFKLPNPFYFIP